MTTDGSVSALFGLVRFARSVLPMWPRTSPMWSMTCAGGRGVVTRGRESSVRHVDQDPNRERGVLLERALIAERDHSFELGCGAIAECASVDADKHLARMHEIAHRVRQDELSAARARPVDHQTVRIDGLYRAAAPGSHQQSWIPTDRLVLPPDVRPIGEAHGLLEHRASHCSHICRDGRRSQPTDKSIEEDDEGQHTQGHQQPSQSHGDVRDEVVLDTD